MGISKNSFRWASIIFSETPESCGQKDFKPNPPKYGGFWFYVLAPVLRPPAKKKSEPQSYESIQS